MRKPNEIECQEKKRIEKRNIKYYYFIAPYHKKENKY
jgi:hypothetical protein